MPSALVPLAQGCEDLEAVSILNILRRGGLEVTAASLQPGPVRGARGVVLAPDADLDAVLDRPFDLVALPGGQPGTEHLRQDPRLGALLKRQERAGGWIAAVCAAPRVLSDAGLLRGRRATCYPGALEGLDHGATLVDAPVVQDGRVVTGRSAGTAMDFALELVGLIQGAAVRAETEARLVRG